jgi:aspartate/methionine/tyrosine aminotransferase
MATTPLGRAVAERGKHWLHAADAPAGLLDLGGDTLAGITPDAVRDATIDALNKHLGDHYARRPGIAPLCRAVADKLAEADIAVDADKDVVIAGGPQEARFVALRALAAGKTVFVPQPAPVDSYRAAVDFAGGTLTWFDPASALPDTNGGLLVLPNPNPATGQVIDHATLAHLAQWAVAADLSVIADETAAPLLRPDVALTHMATLPGMAERTLTLGSFAAIPGMGAWQVAWFAGARSLVTPVRDLKQAMTICSPAASQYAALAGVAQTATDVAPQQIERLEAITALLDEAGVPYREPHTFAYVVADVAALGGGDAFAACAAHHGVQVASGSAWGAPNTVRITANAATLGDALPALEAVLADLTPKEAQP